MAIFTVTNTNDSGAGSLRNAVAQANATAGADSIRFAAGLAGATITLTSGEINITRDLTIDGDIAGVGGANGKADVSISGNDASRIFHVTGAGTDVVLNSLTLTNGHTIANGGAVLAEDTGSLHVNDTSVLDSSSGGYGGGIATISTNVQLYDTLLSGNHAGLNGGGLSSNLGTVDITNTTIHANSTGSMGGGAALAYTVSHIVNSTVTANIADSDGPSTSAAGGIFDNVSNVTISNTVVAENTSGTGATANNAVGAFEVAHNNAFGAGVDFNPLTSAGNLTGVTNTGLGILADHGGAVMTRDANAGSILINAGNNAYAATIIDDANGNARTQGTVDIGATEKQLVVTTAQDVVNPDDGLLSLREAVELADAIAGPNAITFASSLKGQTLTLTNGAISIDSQLKINGDMDHDGKADVTISGGGNSQIFITTSYAADAELRSLNLTGGHGLNGGALYIYGDSKMKVINSTLSGNTATYGGAIGTLYGHVTVVNSLLTGNSASNEGGALRINQGVLNMVNSTVDGNTAANGGGGISTNLGGLVMTNSTITDNHVTDTSNAAGIFQTGTVIDMYQSIIGGNLSGAAATENDVSGTIERAWYSVFGSTVSLSQGISSMMNVSNLGLGELLDNGGAVLTRSPLDGSVLINITGAFAQLPADDFDLNGNHDFLELLPVDGRDLSRIVNGKVDAGAVEWRLNETINGTAGDNVISSGAGKDTVNGRGGNDTIDGGSGGDKLAGGAGIDTLSYQSSTAGVAVDLSTGFTSGGFANGDTITGFENIIGSAYGDTLSGSAAANHLDGGKGVDLLSGGNGADDLIGGAGDDTLLGGAGSDRLTGGTGVDTLTGNAGSDTFVLSPSASSHDVITDFNPVSDSFEISAAQFGAGLAAGVLAAGQFVANATGLAGDANDRFIYNTGTGELFFDSNGSAAGGARLIATFSGLPLLTHDDFLIV